VIAHPPCRLWGQLYKLSTAPESERELALFAVDMVRQCGGVLEHPRGSKLWKAKGLPEPGAGVDEHGGWTYQLDQAWMGHKAAKSTWLYICGVAPAEAPPFLHRLATPTHVVTTSQRMRQKKQQGQRVRLECSKALREHTPPDFARWLVQLARVCTPRSQLSKERR
jgi:hypothetical protein